MTDRLLRSAGLALVLAMAAGLAAPASAQELQEIESPGAAKHQASAFRTDTVEMILAPTKDLRRRNEIEFSIRMKAGDALVYTVSSPGTPEVYQEFHGHTAEKVTFYKKAAGETHHGSLVAPFDGIHGWYFDNRDDKRAKVTLKLSGFYELIPPGEEGNEHEIEANKPAKAR